MSVGSSTYQSLPSFHVSVRTVFFCRVIDNVRAFMVILNLVLQNFSIEINKLEAKSGKM